MHFSNKNKKTREKNVTTSMFKIPQSEMAQSIKLPAKIVRKPNNVLKQIKI